MEKYVGLDVSMEETSVCVVDGGGNIVFEGKTSSQPDALSKLLRAKASGAARIVLETGSLACWLWHELRGRNFPVICLDARHARAALSMRVNKTDRNDARGLAELARMGWYREANVKSMESRYTHSLLAARAKLVDLRRDVENQMRGLLKGFGLPPGKGGIKALLEKIVVIMREAPHLHMLFKPMMLAHSALVTQVEFYDVQILKLAKGDETTRRLMTAPGVGPATALAFRSTIDDPNRFKSSNDVGAYLGLTPRRYQSGELDRTGRISKKRRSPNQVLPVRGRERPAQRGQVMVSLESLGCAAGQTCRHQEGQDRCRPQARCHSALHLGRRYRVPMGQGESMIH